MRSGSDPGGGSELRSDRERGRARRRVLNLLARHPDLVAGNLDRVADLLCEEARRALECARVGLWSFEEHWASEVAYSGRRFEDLERRRLPRLSSPAFFAAALRRRILTGTGIHEFSQVAPASLVAPVLVAGRTWGFVAFQGAPEDGWTEGMLDFAVGVADLAGRAIERAETRMVAERAEDLERGLEKAVRLLGENILFEGEGKGFTLHGSPQPVLGPLPRGGHWDGDMLLARVHPADREAFDARRADWRAAGSPGVLTSRFRFRRYDDLVVLLEVRLIEDAPGALGGRWGLLRRVDPT